MKSKTQNKSNQFSATPSRSTKFSSVKPQGRTLKIAPGSNFKTGSSVSTSFSVKTPSGSKIKARDLPTRGARVSKAFKMDK